MVEKTSRKDCNANKTVMKVDIDYTMNERTKGAAMLGFLLDRTCEWECSFGFSHTMLLSGISCFITLFEAVLY